MQQERDKRTMNILDEFSNPGPTVPKVSPGSTGTSQEHQGLSACVRDFGKVFRASLHMGQMPGCPRLALCSLDTCVDAKKTELSQTALAKTDQQLAGS